MSVAVRPLEELLEIHLEVRPQLDILHGARGRMDYSHLGLCVRKSTRHECLNLRDARRPEVLQQPLVALLQYRELREDVLQPLLNILRVFAAVNRQRLGQVVRKPNVIHDETALLTHSHAIHPGDSLQQVMLAQPLVDVHHLLDRCVKLIFYTLRNKVAVTC